MKSPSVWTEERLGVVMVRDPVGTLHYGQIFLDARDVADRLTFADFAEAA